jgi:hypothetical protein
MRQHIDLPSIKNLLGVSEVVEACRSLERFSMVGYCGVLGEITLQWGHADAEGVFFDTNSRNATLSNYAFRFESSH